MNIAEWLYATARLSPAAPALLTGEAVDADYAAFARRASGLAAGLRHEFGVNPGDRVAILMKNRTQYLEALYGIWWAGAVAVPINAKLHPKEAAVILDDCAASLLVVAGRDDSLAEKADHIAILEVGGADWRSLCGAAPMPRPAQRAGDDLAWLFYTSGTTGKPKGVMLSHANIVAASLCYPVDVDSVLPGDAALYAAPMSHGAGLYNFIHVRRGCRHVIPASGGFDPAEILSLSARLRDVSFFAAPTMVRRLVEYAKANGESGGGIRSIIYGGGPMYLADIEEAVATFGPRFIQIYGQGESPMTITALSRDQIADRTETNWRDRLASVGTPQSCVELRIADSEGKTLPPGEVGEVIVAGPQVMKGYWRNDQATAETLRDGWLWTGDLGRMDENGFLTLTDRSKDVIISGGANIYPREVEEVLLTHPCVVEASVVGRRHPDWGEEVVAFVVVSAGSNVDAAALEAHCMAEIARFKRPKHYIFVPELPKNNYGKIVKTELRKRLEAAD